MYEYVTDKEFISDMKQLCGDIMQRLCHQLKEDCDIGAIFYMVGSGARNLILQNNSNPIDLDYNLEIVRCDDFGDLKGIKESAQKTLNKVLREYDMRDCDDSKSSLTTKRVCFKTGNQTEFSMDIAIVCKDEEGNLYRLIHNKTGWVSFDSYEWRMAPNSKAVREKAAAVKKAHAWKDVRDQYKDIKNRYLRMNDHSHPSYICYIEAVNNVYNSLKHR